MAPSPDPTPPLPPLLAQLSRGCERSPGLVACVASGAVVAGLSLGALATLVMVLWVTSPYPDSGLGGALHVVASLWLLAHGVELVRTETLSGVPAPVAVVPLLLTVVPVWLVSRAAREAAGPKEASTGWTAWCGVSLGYLLVAGVVVVYAAGGVLRPSWWSAGIWLPSLVAGAAGGGVWSARGRLPGVPSGVVRRLAGVWEWGTVVWRAAMAGAVVLAAGGALLVVGSLVWHGELTRASFAEVTDGWSGRFAVLLLALALLPNVAVWGAAFVLGPGFLVGTGYVVAPLGASMPPLLPPFPLLAALPAPSADGSPLELAVGGVPLAAGITLGCCVARGALPGWGLGRLVFLTLGAAAVCGGALAGAAALAGGALGSHRLADFGPVWWQTGGAAACWTAGVGVPAALLTRACLSWSTRVSPTRWRGSLLRAPWRFVRAERPPAPGAVMEPAADARPRVTSPAPAATKAPDEPDMASVLDELRALGGVSAAGADSGGGQPGGGFGDPGSGRGDEVDRGRAAVLEGGRSRVAGGATAAGVDGADSARALAPDAGRPAGGGARTTGTAAAARNATVRTSGTAGAPNAAGPPAEPGTGGDAAPAHPSGAGSPDVVRSAAGGAPRSSAAGLNGVEGLTTLAHDAAECRPDGRSPTAPAGPGEQPSRESVVAPAGSGGEFSARSVGSLSVGSSADSGGAPSARSVPAPPGPGEEPSSRSVPAPPGPGEEPSSRSVGASAGSGAESSSRSVGASAGSGAESSPRSAAAPVRSGAEPGEDPSEQSHGASPARPGTGEGDGS